jgi:hypothetical protein
MQVANKMNEEFESLLCARVVVSEPIGHVLDSEQNIRVGVFPAAFPERAMISRVVKRVPDVVHGGRPPIPWSNLICPASDGSEPAFGVLGQYAA